MTYMRDQAARLSRGHDLAKAYRQALFGALVVDRALDGKQRVDPARLHQLRRRKPH